MKIVLIGDSIRQTYQPLVANKLRGRADVWGPWGNCRHSLWALDHFNDWVADQKPDILHFNFGLHDADIMYDGQFQILPEQYRLCLSRFIKKAKDLGPKLIWATSTPCYKPQENLPISRWPKMTEVDDYNAAALGIVKDQGLAVNDLHQVIMDNDYTKCLKPDGCHMTEFGNQILCDAVVKAIRKFL